MPDEEGNPTKEEATEAAKGTVDDPNVTDPYAHLREKDQAINKLVETDRKRKERSNG